MLRAVGSFGSSVALKSVCLRVLAFATYTSPNPPPLPITIGVACAARFWAVLPRLLETTASAATSSASTSTVIIGRLLLAADPFLPCIVPPFLVSLSSC